MCDSRQQVYNQKAIYYRSVNALEVCNDVIIDSQECSYLQFPHQVVFKKYESIVPVCVEASLREIAMSLLRVVKSDGLLCFAATQNKKRIYSLHVLKAVIDTFHEQWDNISQFFLKTNTWVNETEPASWIHTLIELFIMSNNLNEHDASIMFYVLRTWILDSNIVTNDKYPFKNLLKKITFLKYHIEELILNLVVKNETSNSLHMTTLPNHSLIIEGFCSDFYGLMKQNEINGSFKFICLMKSSLEDHEIVLNTKISSMDGVQQDHFYYANIANFLHTQNIDVIFTNDKASPQLISECAIYNIYVIQSVGEKYFNLLSHKLGLSHIFLNMEDIVSSSFVDDCCGKFKVIQRIMNNGKHVGFLLKELSSWMNHNNSRRTIVEEEDVSQVLIRNHRYSNLSSKQMKLLVMTFLELCIYTVNAIIETTTTRRSDKVVLFIHRNNTDSENDWSMFMELICKHANKNTNDIVLSKLTPCQLVLEPLANMIWEKLNLQLHKNIFILKPILYELFHSLSDVFNLKSETKQNNISRLNTFYTEAILKNVFFTALQITMTTLQVDDHVIHVKRIKTLNQDEKDEVMDE